MTFTYLTLTPSYLDTIEAFLRENYLDATDDPIQIKYSRDFLYWYLRQVPNGLCIGICFNNKIIGIISCLIVPAMIKQESIMLATPNFLCVRHALRHTNVCKMLITELKQRLTALGHTKALFSTSRDLAKPHIEYETFLVPINIPKLFQVGFLEDTDIQHERYPENPLKLMRPKYICSVAALLNAEYSACDLRPHFDSQQVHKTLLPKKNIVYSFVNLVDQKVVDFMSVYIFQMFCVEDQKYITTANLAFVALTTLNINVAMKLLVDKLKSYGVDQLTYQNWDKNKNLSITHFTTQGGTKYYTPGMTDIENLVFYPF